MAITVSELTDVVREESFSFTLSVVGDAMPIAEVIESVTIVDSETQDAGVSINGTTISGRYVGGFNDVIQYISKGSTDKIETPTTVNNIGSVPDGNTLLAFYQDPKHSITKTYIVTVVHSLGTDIIMLEHTIINNWGVGGEWVSRYVNDNV